MSRIKFISVLWNPFIIVLQVSTQSELQQVALIIPKLHVNVSVTLLFATEFGQSVYALVLSIQYGKKLVAISIMEDLLNFNSAS